MLLLRIIIVWYLIDIAINFDLPIKLKNKFKVIKEKIHNVWKKKHRSNLDIDISEFEYPRGNKTLQNINKKLWENYYKCLKQRYSKLGPVKTLHLSSLSVLEGTSIT